MADKKKRGGYFCFNVFLNNQHQKIEREKTPATTVVTKERFFVCAHTVCQNKFTDSEDDEPDGTRCTQAHRSTKWLEK